VPPSTRLMVVMAEGKGKDKDEVAVAFKADGTGKDEVAMMPMGAAKSPGGPFPLRLQGSGGRTRACLMRLISLIPQPNASDTLFLSTLAVLPPKRRPAETPASGADTPATRSLWGRLSALLGYESAAAWYGAMERGPHDKRKLEIKDLKFAVVWKNRTINYLLIMCLVLLGVIINFSVQNTKNSHQKPKQTTNTAYAGSGQQS
jgi:hypothetical protein